MNTWLISDWHFGETRMDIMQRPYANPDAMFDDIRKKHNALVAPNDRVIVIGDAVSKAAEYPQKSLRSVAELNGKKMLIRGNHDEQFTLSDLLSVFETVVPDGDGVALEVDGGDGKAIHLYATHYPTRGRIDRFNLVGHIHGAWKYQLNMLNLSVDVHNFAPIPLSRVPFFITAIEKFYDDDVWCAYSHINKTYIDTRGKKGTYFGQKTAGE